MKNKRKLLLRFFLFALVVAWFGRDGVRAATPFTKEEQAMAGKWIKAQQKTRKANEEWKVVTIWWVGHCAGSSLQFNGGQGLFGPECVQPQTPQAPADKPGTSGSPARPKAPDAPKTQE